MGETTNIAWTEAQKEAARQFVNIEVNLGLRPDPNDLPCADCGHIWMEGERRHDYHHFCGYSREHAFSVIPLCTRCHYARHHPVVTHCKHGHEYTDENTHFRKNGTRECRSCRRNQKKRKRNALWWRERRIRLKGNAHG
jgi:hypothetical protein